MSTYILGRKVMVTHEASTVWAQSDAHLAGTSFQSGADWALATSAKRAAAAEATRTLDIMDQRECVR